MRTLTRGRSHRLRQFLPIRLVRLEARDVPSTSIPLSTTAWTSIGPAPIYSGSVQNSGRIAAVAAHPTDSNIIYVAEAGGGVWKTTNATAANPSWTPLTDSLSSLVSGSIAIAPSNPIV